MTKRLHGERAEVARLAGVAADLLRRRPEVARRLFPDLSALSPQPEPETKPSRRPGFWAWVTLMCLCLLAAVTAVSLVGPYSSRTRWISAERALEIGMAAVIIAVVLAVVLVVVRHPVGYGRVATIVTGVAAVLVAALWSYRLIVGSGDDRDFSDVDLTGWAIWTGVLLVLMVVLMVRFARRYHEALPDDVLARDTAKQRMRAAKELSRYDFTVENPTVRQDVEWRGQLAAFEGEMSAEVLARAKRLGPRAWLVWAVAEGALDPAALRLR